MEHSLDAQVERMLSAGYPQALISGVGEAVLAKVCSGCKKERREGMLKKPMSVISYVHNVSHWIKKVAERAGVRTVFFRPQKTWKPVQEGECARSIEAAVHDKACKALCAMPR